MKTKKNILLAAFGLFIVLQAFFIYKRVHNYPFMIYDMYSRPEAKKAIAGQFLIVAGNDTLILSDLPIMLEGRIVNSLKLYDYHLEYNSDPWQNALESRSSRISSESIKKRAKRTLTNSKEMTDAYPKWLKQFLERNVTGESIPGLRIYKNRIDLSDGSVIHSRKIIEL